MNIPFQTILRPAVTLAIFWFVPNVVSSAGDTMTLIDPASGNLADRYEPTSGQVSFARGKDGLSVKIDAGDEGYPGLAIKPPGEFWDLSSFGHVEARFTNTSDRRLGVILRVDNQGDWKDDPWNTESVFLEPGETGTAKVIFGYQYGMNPGFPLDPSKVVQVLIFTTKAKQANSFRVESLVAAGPAGEKPPVKPDDIRIRPANGDLLGGDPIEPEKQFEADAGVVVEPIDQGDRRALRMSLPAAGGEHRLVVRPPVGRWDLSQACELQLTLKNVGTAVVTPGAMATSDRHNGTVMVFAEDPVPPGASVDLMIPFAAAEPWRGPESDVTRAHAQGLDGTGTKFASDKVDAIHIIARHRSEATILVESITASVTPVQPPEWLGKRPPVEGDWTLTFHDEFDADTIDLERWNIYTENYWDKRSHFTRDNVVMGGGMARLRMERKTGHENDDPARKETNYAVGFLDTWGKWAQRYGYFEARMKLATAPGLWPAFWMMPDRGPTDGHQGKRADTGNAGMEFDIMEHLTRWGPYRYNIAMHWDGYGKGHKSVGSSQIYVRPDPDGFITCGLLWTPGSAVYYCNGEEVARWDNPRISSVPSYPILYLVTGGWDNSPLDDAKLPDDFIIDSIRIWQRKDLASDVDGPMTPKGGTNVR